MNFLQLLAQNQLVFFIFIAAVGLSVGSFLNVVIARLPKMIERREQALAKLTLNDDEESIDNPSLEYNLIWPASKCPKCQTKLRFWHNIPLVSFIMLKGQCHTCKEGISWRYPMVELLTAIFSLVVAVKFGYSVETLIALIITWALIAATFIDFDHKLLPDSITLGLVWFGLLCSLSHSFATPSQAILGAIIGYCSLWFFAAAYELLTRKTAMGYGDFKLFAALGACLGWHSLILIIIFSSLVGSVVGISLMILRNYKRTDHIPFGPYLAAAGWIMLLWGEPIWQTYQNWLLGY